MRTLARTLISLCAALTVTGSGSIAHADPVTVGENSSTFQSACAAWWSVEVEGQPGDVWVCGYLDRWADDYGEYEDRWVWAGRFVETCDENDCTYSSEEYWGNATAEEFEIDVTAGTARFDIVLTEPSGSCGVDLDLEATGPFTSADPGPWPWFYGGVGPGYAFAYVESGSHSAGVWAYPPYGAFLGVGESSYGYREATGAGDVCNWVAAKTADDAQLWSSEYSNTNVSVAPLG